ncbi:MAG: hypothetical protein R2856_25290 [Caldilineaceae bacterium]
MATESIAPADWRRRRSAAPARGASASAVSCSTSSWPFGSSSWIFPMVWLLHTSFKTDQEIFFSPWSLPATPIWDNFRCGGGRQYRRILHE